MKNNSLVLISILLIGGFFSLNSCNKEETSKNDETILNDLEFETANYLWVANLFMLSDVDEETTGESNKSTTIVQQFDCRVITVHENENGEFWPRKWTIDYGEDGCEGFSGVTRKGKIHIILTDFWKKPQSERIITFEEFYQNDIKLEGIKSISNTGVNENGNLTWQKLIDAKVTNVENQEMTWNSERNSEMTAGKETIVFIDDEYEVTGSSYGNNYEGVDFTMEITSPLKYKSGCFWPLSGLLIINVDGESEISIDYGDGECDNIAILTVDGVSTTIILGQK